MTANVRFNVLGPLDVRLGERPVPVPAGRARVLLATLLLRANRPVAVDELVERLWDGSAPNPRRARATLQMAVTRLRQALGEANVVRTAANGYLADVPPGALDLHRFRELAAAGEYAAALDLWRGEPLSDVPSPLLHAEDVAPLLEEHLVVLERRIEADLAAGAAREVVAPLRSLTRAHPLRERFWGQLVLALSRLGRRDEALAAYEELRARLADELGVDPGPNLRRLHRDLVGARPVPRQLPRRAGMFVGRDAELRELDGLLGADAGTVVISAIGGTAGIGKTTLALHWANRVADRFPDGQLYVDLRGFHPVAEPVPPDEAIFGFLEALGVPADRVPVDLDARAALYRTVLADRRVLVLLDNARDSDQVRPLLPGGALSLVLVTSRHDLSGLVVREGAVPLPLGLLAEADARALLERQVGARRAQAEPEAVAALLAHCGGLPLALSILAARAAADASLPLSALAAELADARTRLAALDAGGPTTDLRAVLSWSHGQLSPTAALVFRMLGLHPGSNRTTEAIASMAALPVARTREALRELVRSRLLSQPSPGRVLSHDLVCLYASDQAREHHTEAERRAVLRRLLDHYLHTADRADRLLYPQRDPLDLDPADDAVVLTPLADHREALAWFEIEHQVLVALVERAHEQGFPAHAWRLAWTCATYFQRRGHWRDQLATQLIALACGERLGDLDAQVRAHRNIGLMRVKLGELDVAAEHYRRALELAAELGDAFGRARAHRGLAAVFERQGRYADSLRECRSALELFRETGDPATVAGALNAVGWFHSLLGDHDAALRHCGEALEVFRAVGDRFGQANALDSLGHALHHSGRPAEAVERFRAAVELWRDTGSRDEEANTLRRLAQAERDRGAVADAVAAAHEALAIFSELDPPEAESLRGEISRLSS
ncbi:tetratricopeptide repeat protein [Saccharothrix sp. S26]|uniref:AfsR/SARP family transcriptional regulator n=1 Tax=Saccharothrix sp. S26 TaxID=2907215 RepID=UPI001F3FF66A|nr:BTAD domain-containing putative transcriptional regulator [Saccharothrix sp. S26]MCE7000049.1 tetratricopeptide repeat protein [Saccharothrix sp. S26]